MDLPSPEARIAYLEARVAALEAALERRSRALRALQAQVEPRTLLDLSRLESGLPPLPQHAYDLTLWRETTELTEAEVPETLQDLWRSLGMGDDPDETR